MIYHVIVLEFSQLIKKEKVGIMLEIKMFLGGRRMEESMIDTKKKSKKGKENMDAL